MYNETRGHVNYTVRCKGKKVPEQSIRFGISDGASKRAATWKCWSPKRTGKNDIYLACRALGGVLKTSLHESGYWHIAFLHHYYEENMRDHYEKENNRFIERWERPKELSPGVTLAFRIVTPWTAVKTPFEAANYKKMHWIPSANANKATEIDILISKPSAQVTGWPGMRSLNTQLVDSMLLDSGETVWVVHWEIDMPKFDTTPVKMRLAKGQTKEELKNKDLRVLALGSEKDGSRVLYDCAMVVN